VEKCIEYEVDSARPRCRPKKSLREIVDKDCKEHKLKRKYAMDHNRWWKQIRGD